MRTPWHDPITLNHLNVVVEGVYDQGAPWFGTVGFLWFESLICVSKILVCLQCLSNGFPSDLIYTYARSDIYEYVHAPSPLYTVL